MLHEHIPNIYPSCTFVIYIRHFAKNDPEVHVEVHVEVYVRYMIGTCLPNMYLP